MANLSRVSTKMSKFNSGNDNDYRTRTKAADFLKDLMNDNQFEVQKPILDDRFHSDMTFDAVRKFVKEHPNDPVNNVSSLEEVFRKVDQKLQKPVF
jgi:hypothetical protein